VPFRCRGYDDGRLACAACGTSFTLLEGKGLRGPVGVLSLPELEKLNLAWVRGLKPAGMRITGQLLDAEYGRRHPAVLVLEPEGLQVEREGSPVRRVAYGEIESVLVEGNRKLEVFYRTAGPQGCVVFLPPQRYALFLQHFLRLAAFANPYARYQGSNRVQIELEPD
jgi:hypothetical protein